MSLYVRVSVKVRSRKMTFAFFKNIFENILSLTGVESGFFADSANIYQDLPFELLNLDLCGNVVIGRK